MPTLKLYFLGPPRLELEGEVVETDTRKAIALLAYLALTGERQERDALAALLWPELDGRRAKAALRRTLSTLKAAVGEGHLFASRSAIGLEMGDAWCDVLAFRRLLAHEALEEAVALYRDEFMAGFSLRDSLEFDDWQLLEGQNLRRALESGLEELTRQGLARGDFEGGLAHAHRWLRADPLREEAHRQLMRLYAAAGRRDTALRQYRECVRVLEEELGVSPLPETTALYEAIQENRLLGDHPPAALSAGEAVSPPAIPFIGREAELARLRERYEEIGPAGRLLIIAGEVGIGKTRLAETFLSGRPAAGRLVARCYAGEHNLAYAPFLQALTENLGRPGAAKRLAEVDPLWLAEAARLLPSLAPPGEPRPLDGPGAQSRFFEGLAQVVAALLGGEEPGILFIDDAHWADAASLDLLAYLIRRLDHNPCLILLTAREEELPPDHRLYALLSEARRSGAGSLLPLPRLSEGEVARLAAASGTPPAIVPRLFRETEGLPSFLIAYLTGLLADGEAAVEADWPLPLSVRDLLHNRLARLDETGRQLLQTAAAIGRAFEPQLLQQASGRGEEEVIAGLERLLGQGLLVEMDDSHLFDFSHDKLRQIMYEETRFVRRRLLHRRLAAALEEQGRRRRSAALSGQLAHHYQLAGQEGEAARAFVEAGDQARGLYANREALAHYQAALALGYEGAAGLHEACGDLLTVLGEYAAARSRFETAAALAGEEGQSRLEHKLGRVYLRQGEWVQAERRLEQARRLLPLPAGAAEAVIFIDWSYSAYRQQQPERARELAERARLLAAGVGDDLALAQAYNLLGLLARQAGELDGAGDYGEESVRLAQTAGHLPAQAAGLNNLALTCAAAGDLVAAQGHLEQALALSIRYGDRHHQAALLNNLADLCHQTGREEEAMANLKRSVAIYAEIGGEEAIWQPEVWKLTEW